MKDYLLRRRSEILLRYGIVCRSSALIRHLKKLVSSKSGRILDIGTADGLVFRNLTQSCGLTDCIGTDTEIDFLRAAEENVPFVVQADGTHLPFQNGSMDIVVSAAVLKHIGELDGFLQECSRVLRTRGILVVVDPTPFGIMCGLILGYFSRKIILHILSLEDLEQMLSRHSFTTVSKERFMLAPVPFPGSEALERMIKKVGLERLLLNQIICARRETV
jgi:ubiquinone/menaquinone biosynthesis C-methylase UbiE